EKNHNITKFAGKWMELENIILTEISQTQKDKHVLETRASFMFYKCLAIELHSQPLVVQQVPREERRIYMTPLEPTGSPPVRPEHANTEEAEEINPKNDLKKMVEALKEEIKNSLKELEENKESQEKAIRKMKEIVQDVKIEIKKIKKTKIEAMLEIENLTKRTGTTDASITNRMQLMEQRISDVEDTIEKIDSLVKENTKTIIRKIQEIWDTIKIPNLRIIGIEEGEEYQLKGTGNIFNKVIEENFYNLKKEIPMKIQEAYRIPNRLDTKKRPLAT
ncbi:hypothetical protein STEG23_034930, partial [Scotinomys teguina]